MTTKLISLVVCVLACFVEHGRCFLLNSSSSIAGNTYQDILSLLVDEKNTRHLLETEMSALKGRLDTMEAELIKEKQKEINNRQYLLDRFAELENENNKLKDSFSNVSRQLNMQTSKYNSLMEQYAFLSNRTTSDNITLHNTLMDMYKSISNVTSIVYQNERKLEKYGMQLGFTLRDVNKTTSTRSLVKFINALFNDNNMFSMNTGEFVCQIPGIYFFAVTIVREPGITQSYCFITVNGVEMIATVGYGSTTDGYSSGTTTLVYRLRVGDSVYLSRCVGIDHMNWSSSFSGFLVKPDQ